MAKRGRYILHVDGTCEGDSPHLFCGLDGISEIVLDNIKIPSERKELLIPFFQRIKKQYGDPVALVHDMGIGILMKAKDNRPFVQVHRLLENVLSDKELNKSAVSIEDKAKVFDKLREALRIALPEGKNGLNDEGDETDIKTIEKKVSDFRDWLVIDEKRNKTYTKMIEQMDKYWEKLFADPLLVNTP